MAGGDGMTAIVGSITASYELKGHITEVAVSENETVNLIGDVSEKE
jgi:hypothetical protein